MDCSIARKAILIFHSSYLLQASLSLDHQPFPLRNMVERWQYPGALRDNDL